MDLSLGGSARSNGIYRDMTAEEIEQWQQSMSEAPAPEPTTEERIAALEDGQATLSDELAAAKILLGLEE